jgi:hypothetical protein
MDCIEIGSKIVTLAIQMHGAVINLDLSPEKTRIFENVRLFSKVGDFDFAVSSDLAERHILYKVNEMFQKDLTVPTVELINEYIEYSKPKYKNFLTHFNELNETRDKNICRKFDNITFDKSLSAADVDDDSGYIECIMSRLMPRFQGFFVVSIHEKTGENSFSLLYPKQKTDKQNLNLLLVDDFKKFADIFGSELPDLREYSNTLPSYKHFIDVDKKIENDNMLTQKQKEIRLEELKQQFFRLLDGWNLTMKDNKIESIKLSVMIDFIKHIVGPSSKINLLDYSCNNVSMFVPKSQLPNKQYMVENDIEQGYSSAWGGKRKSKSHHKKYNSKSKKHKKTHRRHKNNTHKNNTHKNKTHKNNKSMK